MALEGCYKNEMAIDRKKVPQPWLKTSSSDAVVCIFTGTNYLTLIVLPDILDNTSDVIQSQPNDTGQYQNKTIKSYVIPSTLLSIELS